MRFNPMALLVLIAFLGLLVLALRGTSDLFHLAEAVVTVLILVGVAGLGLRNGQRSRTR
jgi:hypothetical protein